MGIGKTNAAGGGASLNFGVKAYSTESVLLAATPKENTIGIITTTAINGWEFAAVEPMEPVEGMVWISTGTSSPVQFNALKKNEIAVYPLSVKQYVSGAWVDKTAKSYQGGKWVDWIVWLYNKGDEFTSLTGGWEEKHYGTDSTKKGIVKGADRITVSIARTSGVHQESIAGTVNAVDLANVNFIRANIAGYTSNGSAKYNRIGVYADSIREPAAYANPGADGTVELDISALTGLHYVFFGICTLWNSGNVTASFEVTDIRFD